MDKLTFGELKVDTPFVTADAARAAAGQPKVLTGHPADYAELPMFAPNP